MLLLPDANRRIQWETFTVQDQYAVQFIINKGIAIVSDKMISVMLAEKTWNGAQALNPDSGQIEIGYGIGDPEDAQGYTEPQAYAEWVGWVRNEQRKLRAQLPIIGVTQTAYDALLSLYIDTGDWRRLEADEGTYDLASAVKNGNWLLVADIIARGKVNPALRKKEARIIQLADYAFDKDRNMQATAGLRRLRKLYTIGIKDEFVKKQTEFVYYRQLGSFLPGMSDLRKRRVVAQATT